MTDPANSVAKWQKAQLTERSSYQQHFLDLCDLRRLSLKGQTRLPDTARPAYAG